MSQQLINHSSDLKRLRDDGYEIEIRSSYLLVKSVPYLNAQREIKYGTLVSDLTLGGNKTVRPATHVVYFIGEFPCRKDGTPIEGIRHTSENKTLQEGLVVNHSFSNKPSNGYDNYHQKMERYAEIISAPAMAVDDTLTPKTFKVVEGKEENSVFVYLDTNSSRADIGPISDKVKGQRIAIVGLGGTGSYILDFLAKNPVAEIHLFDGDDFLQHNAFRAPGAASLGSLHEKLKKTDYFKKVYSEMHRGVVSHPYNINSSNFQELEGMDFIFVCLDKGEIKEQLFQFLENKNISFVDVGIGVIKADDKLGGIVRTTLSTKIKREHVKKRVSFSNGIENEYSKNIQIAELNALSASFAVIKWKKLMGYYRDVENEYHATYTMDVNMLLSEENET